MKLAGFAIREAKEAWATGDVSWRGDKQIANAVLEMLCKRQSVLGPDTLILNRVERDESIFVTDRGEASLPVLRFHGPGLLPGGAAVLDPDVPVWWSADDHPDSPAWLRRPALLDPAGRAVVWASSTDGRTYPSAIQFEEHRAFVVARPVVQAKSPIVEIPETVGLQEVVLEGRLAEPLGDRVLVSDSFQPVAAVERYWSDAW